MKSRINNQNIFVLIIGIAVVIIMVYTMLGVTTVSDEQYITQVEKDRKEKNAMFKNGSESPLEEQHKAQFQALSYFDVDTKLRVLADFKPIQPREYLFIEITDGSQRKYEKSGYAQFEIEGEMQRLLVLKSTDTEEKHLFIPFYDETSALSTYGGGRYVEPQLLSNGKIEIDFNMAYNPYCAYNHTFRCPIPPKENKITVKINAGEKKFDFPD